MWLDYYETSRPLSSSTYTEFVASHSASSGLLLNSSFLSSTHLNSALRTASLFKALARADSLLSTDSGSGLVSFESLGVTKTKLPEPCLAADLANRCSFEDLAGVTGTQAAEIGPVDSWSSGEGPLVSRSRSQIATGMPVDRSRASTAINRLSAI